MSSSPISPMDLPPRMFAAGDEPVGERVNSYHKVKNTRSIMEALDPEEIEFLKNSTFGKVLSLEDNPPFSGAFGQFLLGRLLKVNKKFEVWFLFAGRPTRFSLREFAIVTGLNCAKLPNAAKKKSKNPLKQKLYWTEIFGSLKACSLELAVDMLKRRKIKDDARLRLACLAIISSVLLPSSHNIKIIPEYVELSKDFDAFLAYPWGRISFEFLITNLVGKDEVCLAQSTVALKGYVDSIQHVMIASVPMLKEEVIPNEPIALDDSESEGDNGDKNVEGSTTAQPPLDIKFEIVPGNARKLERECKVVPLSILDDPLDFLAGAHDLEWESESTDVRVDNTVRLIGEEYSFKKEMFKGGLTSAQLRRLRKSKKMKDKEATDALDKDMFPAFPDPESSDSQPPHGLANQISSLMKDFIGGIELRVSNSVGYSVERAFLEFEKKVEASLLSHFQRMHDVVIKSVGDMLSKTNTTPLHENELFHSESPDSPPGVGGLSSQARDKGPPGLSQTDHASNVIDDVIHDLNRQKRPGQDSEEGARRAFPRRKKSLLQPVVKPSVVKDKQIPIHVPNSVTTTHSEFPSTSNSPPSAAPSKMSDTNVEATAQSQAGVPLSAIPEEKVSDVPEVHANPINYAIPADETRRSTRSRNTPAVYQDYHCGAKIAVGYSINPCIGVLFSNLQGELSKKGSIEISPTHAITALEISDIALRPHLITPEVMDALMLYLGRQLPSDDKVQIFDTSLPAILMEHHSRFLKIASKDRNRFKFSGIYLQSIISALPEWIYFPFNIDQQHWVGVCIDTKASAVHVIDCNTAFKSESLMKKELNPVANLMPYITKQAEAVEVQGLQKAFTISRLKGVPQIGRPGDSALMVALQIQAHSSNGIAGVKTITSRIIPDAAKHFAVNFYNDLISQ